MDNDQFPAAAVPKTRIHLVDADAFSRSAIISQLGETSDLIVESHYDTVAEALSQKEFQTPDMLLINSENNDPMSNQGINAAVRDLSRCKVALLTLGSSMQTLNDAYESGIAGVISKRMVSAGLATYVRAIAEGYWVFMRPEAGGPTGGYPLREGIYKSYIRNLSPLSYDILRHVALGLTNAQIARRVLVSEGTVKKRLTDMCFELGISKRVHLTVIACDAGVVRAKDLLSLNPEESGSTV
ncbi:hypothetical protein C1H84_16840 [Glutamicibacter soli]|uniref:Response regulatory domain-containing protein n=1 Tax=Glutamicibacter soli TaxID=453836 RepID=A0A365Y8A0_9MICC|nr:LuxR C-terminal-related transcriptional regulator [Glutamicibacter soli]RBL98905.1 hypothetical protein C1H84_16840 [Glutamicibacter soli]